MPKINFNATPADAKLIDQIVERAMKIVKREKLGIQRINLEMSLAACHLNGTPLKLAELLADTSGSFGHDVFGIHKHINRSTGKLDEPVFTPRYAKEQ